MPILTKITNAKLALQSALRHGIQHLVLQHSQSVQSHHQVPGGREAGRQGGREAGRQGGREAGRQGGREAGRDTYLSGHGILWDV